MDVCLVECCNEIEIMSPNTTEVASMSEVKNMDVEPLETPRESAEPGIRTLGPPQVEGQSANEEAVGEFGAPTVGNELTGEANGG